MNALKISDNKRYLIDGENKPFIWIADTCWTLPQRMKWDDVDYYMKKRKSQGFTVLQIVALDPEQDKEMRDPSGNCAIFDHDLNQPNELYFKYLDYILERAEFYGFYVLLLPVWGELVVGHNWMGEFSEKIVTRENAYDYGKWIGKRYSKRTNIIWCLGGDRMPIHLGEDYRPVWRRMAEGIAKGVLDCDLHYNIPDKQWEKILITYHACYEVETGKCSTMSYWTDEECWISFIMLQSGHGRGIANYRLIEQEYQRTNTMPVFDGEPAYEMMPSSWPSIGEFHKDWIVRKRAYWSLFAGAFGHTYGHSSVWCMISEKERDMVRVYSWFESLDQPGANQMKFLYDFLCTFDLANSVPSQDVLLDQQERLKETSEESIDQHRQACINVVKSVIYVYLPSGGVETIDVSRLHSDSVQISFFNPKNGKYYDADMIELTEGQNSNTTIVEALYKKVVVKTPTEGEEQDWICIISK